MFLSIFLFHKFDLDQIANNLHLNESRDVLTSCRATSMLPSTLFRCCDSLNF